ncbi:MAG: hypothetical protein AAF961_11600, partial [Planctomycetota bacterium]
MTKARMKFKDRSVVLCLVQASRGFNLPEGDTMSMVTRRTALGKLGAALPLAALPRAARGARLADRPRLALVGCGSRGASFLQHVHYVCDPDASRLAKAAHRAGVDS